jgi:aminoglycoside 3'-phosphotransferase-3
MENIFNIEISNNLSNKLREYTVNKDEIGLSPSKVYKITGSNETLYLKYSQNIYKSTTFCVGRETDVINWLNGKINVPKIIFSENYQGNDFMLMTELKGLMIEESNLSLSSYVNYMVKALKELQSIDINNCPFDSNITFRLNELKYLLDNNLADTDVNNWEKSTEFTSPEELYKWLCNNKPNEELVFSHGDLCGSNIFLDKNEIGFIDLGRAGKADKWYDIAFCVREIMDWENKEKYTNDFFTLLGIEPDWDKINYYILLDELF